MSAGQAETGAAGDSRERDSIGSVAEGVSAPFSISYHNFNSLTKAKIFDPQTHPLP
jgi:hypothetical protein